MPSEAFARYSDELRAARPEDDGAADDMLLEQMRAVEDAPTTAAAIPDGVRAIDADAGGRPARWLIPDDAPEHPHPAALDDAVAAYDWLVRDGLPEGIAVSGESAGGGLALALLARLRDDRRPLPLGAALLSPWVDLSAEAGWRDPGSDRDEPLMRRSALALAARLYAGEHALDDPAVSPARADLRGLPPLLVQCGTAEMLHADAVALAERAAAAGVRVRLDEWAGMWHVFQSAGDAFPEARQAVERAGAFVRDVLPAAAAPRTRRT